MWSIEHTAICSHAAGTHCNPLTCNSNTLQPTTHAAWTHSNPLTCRPQVLWEYDDRAFTESRTSWPLSRCRRALPCPLLLQEKEDAPTLPLVTAAEAPRPAVSGRHSSIPGHLQTWMERTSYQWRTISILWVPVVPRSPPLLYPHSL